MSRSGVHRRRRSPIRDLRSHQPVPSTTTGLGLGIGEELAWPPTRAAPPCRRSRVTAPSPVISATPWPADEFDMSFFQNSGLDHGCSPPSIPGRTIRNGRPPSSAPQMACCSSLRAPPAATSSARRSATLASRAPGGSEGRGYRHRRPVAPGSGRALRFHRPALGPEAERSRRILHRLHRMTHADHAGPRRHGFEIIMYGQAMSAPSSPRSSPEELACLR